MNNKFIIFLLIAVLSLGSGYFLGRLLIPEFFQSLNLPKLTQDNGGGTNQNINLAKSVDRPGKITLRLDKAQAKVGETVKAEIIVNTDKKAINGTDIILNFDSESITVLDSQLTATDSADFSIFPVNEIDNKSGEIKYSALTAPDSAFMGETMLGSFLFQPKKAGKLDLNIVFSGRGETKDSNLAEQGTGEDILGSVENAALVVKE